MSPMSVIFTHHARFVFECYPSQFLPWSVASKLQRQRLHWLTKFPNIPPHHPAIRGGGEYVRTWSEKVVGVLPCTGHNEWSSMCHRKLFHLKVCFMTFLIKRGPLSDHLWHSELLSSQTCFRRRKNQLVDRVIVADLDGCYFHWLCPLSCVKDGQLPIVAASHQCVWVLGVVLQTQHGRRGTQDVLWLIGIL